MKVIKVDSSTFLPTSWKQFFCKPMTVKSKFSCQFSTLLSYDHLSHSLQSHSVTLYGRWTFWWKRWRYLLSSLLLPNPTSQTYFMFLFKLFHLLLSFLLISIQVCISLNNFAPQFTSLKTHVYKAFYWLFSSRLNF